MITELKDGQIVAFRNVQRNQTQLYTVIPKKEMAGMACSELTDHILLEPQGTIRGALETLDEEPSFKWKTAKTWNLETIFQYMVKYQMVKNNDEERQSLQVNLEHMEKELNNDTF
jgi:hypothetical protein